MFSNGVESLKTEFVPNKWVSKIQMNRHNKSSLNICGDEKKAVPISLANHALEELTNRAGAEYQKQRKSSLDRLCESLLSLNGESSKVIQSMLSLDITPREIFEIFIPDAARQLGRCWVENTLSFAEVTLATSRLQTVAREFEDLYIGASNSGANGIEIMIINPKGEQHTFGAQMISRQFRRLGASPYLSINNNLSEIKKIIDRHKFKLIGLSLSDYKLCDKQSEVRSIIEIVKKLKIPIIAGGSLIHSHKNAVKSLGVDLITEDAVNALRFSNINLSRRKAAADLVAT